MTFPRTLVAVISLVGHKNGLSLGAPSRRYCAVIGVLPISTRAVQIRAFRVGAEAMTRSLTSFVQPAPSQ
jgi:hypothetical protein